MKYFVIPALVAGALSLGGCATGGGGSGDACSNISDIIGIAKCAQQFANNTCGFLADLDPIIQLVPVVKDYRVLGQEVCAAVTTIPPLQARKSGKQAITVHGVVVTGRFTR
jgi:hypothetical protein